ncbi:hypothetical protein F5887DRAFT_195633 [Amanita rubescens]|nr:hypothetical protein F5887DRAFT_195633 [Amanita rubescens]
MVDKDAATKNTHRSKHEKLVGEGEAETRKNKKNATPALGGDEIQQYDDEARKKEKKIAKAAAAAVLAELGIDENDDDGVQEPKKKRKAVSENVPSELSVASAKEKKKERKKIKSTAIEDPAAEEIKSKVKKRKNKETVSDNSDVFSPGASAPDGPSKSKSRAGRKKRATSADDTSAVVETVSAPDEGPKESKKSKKRKHIESLSADGETITSAPDIVAEGQLPKKKRKGETKVSDPAQDKSLSEQSLKGLSYAFSQYCNPAEWKFNKARQNWLIRNIWSPEMIPDEHMPLLLWYLKNVKGGARDALVKTCQTHLQPDQSKDESTSPAETTTTSLFGLSAEVLEKSSDKTQGTKRSRAVTILEMLEVQ